MKKIQWETLETKDVPYMFSTITKPKVERTRTPEGWLVRTNGDITYVPDVNGAWEI